MNQPPQNPYPQQMQQMPPPQKSSGGGWGIGLILLVIVLPVMVAIIGILAVLGIYGTRKYIATAKQVEARSSLSQIGSLAKAAYARDGKVCPSASSPIPVKVPSGAKYQSSASEWESDAAKNAGFACLGFSMMQPQYYQYEYKATATSFTVTARGDLDADGINSELQLQGQVVGSDLIVAPTLMETNPGE
jgi:type IV pilus assembly protein PilA